MSFHGAWWISILPCYTCINLVDRNVLAPTVPLPYKPCAHRFGWFIDTCSIKVRDWSLCQFDMSERVPKNKRAWSINQIRWSQLYVSHSALYWTVGSCAVWSFWTCVWENRSKAFFIIFHACLVREVKQFSLVPSFQLLHHTCQGLWSGLASAFQHLNQLLF